MNWAEDIADVGDHTRTFRVVRLALTESQRHALREFAAAGFETAEDIEAIAALRRLADALEELPPCTPP